MVQRYRDYHYMGKDDTGAYVLYEDYEKLEIELKDAMEMIDVHYKEGRNLREDEFGKLKYRLGRCHDKLRDLHQELFPEGKIT